MCLRDCPGLELVLPARKEAVENAFLDEMRGAARLAIYRAMAAQPSPRPAFEDWTRARGDGIELAPPPAMLRPWRPPVANVNDWRDPPKLAPAGHDALVVACDPEPPEAQALWRAAERTGTASRLFEADRRLDGYDWYDAFDRVTAMTVQVAGNETTTNLIGNGMLALLANPDQLARLRDDPGLMPKAVDELLRFDSPVQTTFRRARADCAVNGLEVRARDNVAVLVGAANRDPVVFEEPDRLDVGRAPCPHLSLGRGIHHCLGAPLARLEGRIAFEMLLERFARIDLIGGRPRFHNGIVLRGLRSLPLRCGSA